MREKRVCSRCGSGFFVSKNDIKRGRGVYCSISCSSAALNERQQKHPALKSGDRFHPATAAELQTLEIVTKSGVHVFTVEVAKTDQERATGLMYRRELPEGRGMLFDFSPEQQVSMWMKNTFIPLDMIFIRSDGRILRIAGGSSDTCFSLSGGAIRRSRGPSLHASANLQARQERHAVRGRQDQGLAARLRARAAPRGRAADGLDLLQRHEAAAHPAFRHPGRGGSYACVD